jgi:hypothetical protein
VHYRCGHIISFKYVPSQQRILYNNSIAIFWNCYLSLAASGHQAAAPAKSDASWDADAALVQLSEMYHNVQSMLGIHPQQPATTALAADLCKLYRNVHTATGGHTQQHGNGMSSWAMQLHNELQSMLGMHVPEPAHGLAGVLQQLRSLHSSSVMAPYSEGVAGNLQHTLHAVMNARQVVQDATHDTMHAANTWLHSLMQVCALRCNSDCSSVA